MESSSLVESSAFGSPVNASGRAASRRSTLERCPPLAFSGIVRGPRGGRRPHCEALRAGSARGVQPSIPATRGCRGACPWKRLPGGRAGAGCRAAHGGRTELADHAFVVTRTGCPAVGARPSRPGLRLAEGDPPHVDEQRSSPSRAPSLHAVHAPRGCPGVTGRPAPTLYVGSWPAPAGGPPAPPHRRAAGRRARQRGRAMHTQMAKAVKARPATASGTGGRQDRPTRSGGWLRSGCRDRHHPRRRHTIRPVASRSRRCEEPAATSTAARATRDAAAARGDGRSGRG
jgi:hypothetical protein